MTISGLSVASAVAASRVAPQTDAKAPPAAGLRHSAGRTQHPHRGGAHGVTGGPSTGGGPTLPPSNTPATLLGGLV